MTVIQNRKSQEIYIYDEELTPKERKIITNCTSDELDKIMDRITRDAKNG
jgi:hypothetical protein